MAQKFYNNVKMTFDGAHNDTTTTFTVNEGSALPAISAPDYVLLTIPVGFGGTETGWEIVKVTNHGAASTTLTVVRAQEGTTGLSWADNDTMQARLTKGSIEAIQQAQGLGIIIAAQQGLIGY